MILALYFRSVRRRNLIKSVVAVNHFLTVLAEYFFNDLSALLSLSADWESMKTRSESQPFCDSPLPGARPAGVPPFQAASKSAVMQICDRSVKKNPRRAAPVRAVISRGKTFYGKLTPASTAF